MNRAHAACGRLLLLVALTVGLVGCDRGIDWSRYPPEIKDRIDQLVREGDCDGLRDLAGTSFHGEPESLLAYIRDKADECEP